MTESDGAAGRGQIRAAGDRAWLIEPGPSVGAAEFAAALRRARIAGVEDILPAATTVLVTVVSPLLAESVRRAAADLMIALSRGGGASGAVVAGTMGAGTMGAVTMGAVTRGPADGDPVVIPVHYVGEDLEQVAELLGTSVRAVIDRHTSTLWRCEFVGFAPGFGYLRASHDELSVPRRERARTSVPAGAVALAGGYSAVYPRSSPGGWQLIGHTEAVLWDERRDPPALIRAGGAVRFVEAGR
ncbi:5-oxoprolinase subunit B family protein [Nocardia shimofusensis]|uniref:5-oxoprolinase subunit B family protein n=1 Tax=Nocardia shimofusensis TaxID=228596 RepID=UPI0008302BD2|nr:carboxyltransferase domain-containing protein [Nocardia shimofusensis]